MSAGAPSTICRMRAVANLYVGLPPGIRGVVTTCRRPSAAQRRIVSSLTARAAAASLAVIAGLWGHWKVSASMAGH